MPEELREVRTLIMDVTPLFQQECYQRIYNRMPDFRKEKADRLRPPRDKARSVGAWYLRMLAESRYGQIKECSCNLSHSGDYALCSVGPAGERVGCDVEMIKDFREGVARRFFCEEEYEDIMKQEDAARTEQFYRYWVLKESFMKATRQGMAMGLDRFSIAFDQDGKPSLMRKPRDVAWQFFFKEYEISGARAAVCSTCSEFADSMEVCDVKCF